jgi:hypothetical protein
VDIRQSLAGDEKQGGRSSPLATVVTNVIRDGRQRIWPMMSEPKSKETQGSKDELGARNHPMAEPTGGRVSSPQH